MRAMFFGTPAIAVPALRALCEVLEVSVVVCQPDRAAGRGLSLTAPAVKVEGERLGLEILQPHKLKDGALASLILSRNVDVALVMAYGRILPADALRAPRLGCLNLHASLLPAYRGAAPIQRCLMDGSTETGMCLMQMDEGMDTGDVLATRRISIGPSENHQQLSDRLAELAAEMTRADLPRFLRGELTAMPQDATLATYAKPLTSADLALDFKRSAADLKNHIRALAPQPGAFAFIERPPAPPKRLRILEARVATDDLPTVGGEAPGQVLAQGPRLFVRTGSGLLEVLSAQLEGRKVLPAAQLVQGRALAPGDRLVAS